MVQSDNKFQLGPPIESTQVQDVDESQPPLDHVEKTRYERIMPVIACGAGLFSDGYLNGVIGSVTTILERIYGSIYTDSSAVSNVAALVFVGEVVGIAIFGYTADHYSRKWSLFVSTIILFIFAALAAGSYAGGTAQGVFRALAAYRFLIGVGIGGEYPAGSVGCAESTGELKAGSRNRWFIWFTNMMIDIGFVVAAITPMIVVLATGDHHLKAAWRICLGIGVIPPLSLLYFRWKLNEPEAFKRESMAKTRTPWWLVIKFYWFRLVVVSIIWFTYDFSSFAFGTYSSSIIDTILPGKTPPLWKTFGWNTLLNFFYLPGAFLGSFVSDWIGPRKALAYGVTAQALVGFLMAGVYSFLHKEANIAGFIIVYGVFLSLGELGPGDNIGLIASKTCATPIRGQYYGVAAAMGKIGAFVGTYLFPILQRDGGGANTTRGGQYPFWVASSLCVLSAFLAFFCLPEIQQDTIDFEDRRFRAYLAEHGYDTSKMGLIEGVSPGRESSDEDHSTTKVETEKIKSEL